jgi:transporter family protein
LSRLRSHPDATTLETFTLNVSGRRSFYARRGRWRVVELPRHAEQVAATQVFSSSCERTMNLLSHWQFWAILSAAFAAATALLSKAGLRGVDPDAAQLVRTVVVVISLGLALSALGKVKAVSELTTRNWTFLVLAGLATAGSWACYFRALKVGEASRVAAVDKLSVAMVAVFAAVTLSERLGPFGWLGISLATAGAFLLSWAK